MALMDSMAANLLRSLGLDPDTLIGEFSGRVEQFEQGLNKLNTLLVSIDARLSRIEGKLEIQSPSGVLINGLSASPDECRSENTDA